VLFAAAHASTSAISEDGIRAATWGSRPLAEGRLSLFGATFIDFFIIPAVPFPLDSGRFADMRNQGQQNACIP
jgi:hypothetical protein